MILSILIHQKVDWLAQPVSDFLTFLRQNDLLTIKNDHNLYFNQSDSLKLIIEKLIFSKGQIVRKDKSEVLKGLISIHDIIANFV